jgi:hypothetical protein
MTPEEKLVDAYLEISERDPERAMLMMAKEIIRTRQPKPGYERGGSEKS